MLSAVGGTVLLVVTVGMCMLRTYLKQQGEYATNEAKDSKHYDNPDAAVAMSKTGQPEISRKKEWFI